MIGLAIFSTALGTMVYFRLLRTLGSIGTTSNSYLRAAASVVLGYFALHERPAGSTAAGLALVLVGVATLVGRPSDLNRGRSSATMESRAPTVASE